MKMPKVKKLEPLEHVIGDLLLWFSGICDTQEVPVPGGFIERRKFPQLSIEELKEFNLIRTYLPGCKNFPREWEEGQMTALSQELGSRLTVKSLFVEAFSTLFPWYSFEFIIKNKKNEVILSLAGQLDTNKSTIRETRVSREVYTFEYRDRKVLIEITKEIASQII